MTPSSFRRRLALGILPLFFLTMSSCQNLPKKSVSSSQTLSNPFVEQNRAAELTQLRSFSGFGSLDIQSSRESIHFDVAILAEFPNLLYLSFLDDLGQEKARFVANGQEVLWENHESGETLRQAQDAHALKKALKIPLSVEELVAHLLLRLPEEILSSEVDAAGQWRVRGPASELQLAGSPLRILEVRGFQGKAPSYRLQYEEDRMTKDGAYPQKILWTLRRPKLSLSLRVLDFKLNPSLNTERFRISP